ncbi:MAG: hypothetical protein HKP10_00460, partial [Kiritimatiellales bacterium]|nr:hypothetical protein [Kiritimatiellales bacterium]
DWDTAVSMLENNLVLRNAAEEIIKADVAVKRVFLDRIPQLTLQGIYSQTVSDITELTTDNFSASINALFGIHGFLKLRMDYYGAALARYKARQEYEMACREEVVNLYSLFRQYRHMQAAGSIEALQASRPAFGDVERMELELKQKQRETELWLGLSAALGNYSNQWMVVTDHLPEFDYSSSTPQWDNPGEAGGIYVTLQAIELEGARLRELGVVFQYWPQLNMRVYSPSVYLLSAGDRGGFEFDANDIRFEATVRMKLDTNFKLRDQLREARRNTDLLKQKLYEDAQERTKKLLDAHDALAVIEARLQRLAAQKKMLHSFSDSSSYDVFEKTMAERIELMTQQIALEKERDSIVPILWIADESMWREGLSGTRL